MRFISAVTSAPETRDLKVEGKKPGEFVASETGQSWAVVIGINDNEKAGRLTYAVEDAKADVRQGLFQLSPKDQARFRDLQPTSTTLRPGDWSIAQMQVITLEATQTETRGTRGLRSLGMAGAR